VAPRSTGDNKGQQSRAEGLALQGWAQVLRNAFPRSSQPSWLETSFHVFFTISFLLPSPAYSPLPDPSLVFLIHHPVLEEINKKATVHHAGNDAVR
jgi:hypothetical protein